MAARLVAAIFCILAATSGGNATGKFMGDDAEFTRGDQFFFKDGVELPEPVNFEGLQSDVGAFFKRELVSNANNYARGRVVFIVFEIELNDRVVDMRCIRRDRSAPCDPVLDTPDAGVLKFFPFFPASEGVPCSRRYANAHSRGASGALEMDLQSKVRPLTSGFNILGHFNIGDRNSRALRGSQLFDGSFMHARTGGQRLSNVNQAKPSDEHSERPEQGSRYERRQRPSGGGFLSLKLLLSAMLCAGGFYFGIKAGEDFFRGTDPEAAFIRIALGFCAAAGGLCVSIALIVSNVY
jgi:hypothetical protein